MIIFGLLILRPSRTECQGKKGSNFGFLTLKYLCLKKLDIGPGLDGKSVLYLVTWVATALHKNS